MAYICINYKFMSEEQDDAVEIDDLQLGNEISIFVESLLKLEEVGLNLFPNEKQNLQKKLIRLINQRLDYLDFEEDD